jgi:hypothetical protein
MRKDVISGSLGLEPIIDSPGRLTSVLPVLKAEKNDDYEYARRNLYDVIEKGNNALEDIMDVAKQSESPRAYEVVTNLIKTMVDANKDLLQLAKTRKELEAREPEKAQVTNNNLFVGSSAELLKMIKNGSE